jgi:hypothetical protein
LFVDFPQQEARERSRDSEVKAAPKDQEQDHE